MASSNPVIRQIELAAKAAFPRDQDARFRERNRLRALAGLPPEKRVRGGVAGAWDRNDHLVAPALGIVAGALLPGSSVVRSLVPALSGASSVPAPSLSPSMLTPVAGSVMPVLTSAARGTVGQTVGSTILTGLINRFLPPGPPSLGQTPVPQPKEGLLGRLVSRVLPGGMTGREWTPVNDMTDRVGRPLAVYPAERVQTVGPAGYVMVTMNGERIAMLRSFAIRAGLYKAPPKPPISGYDMRAINRAAAASKRVKKLAGKVGFRVERKGAARAVVKAFGKRK